MFDSNEEAKVPLTRLIEKLDLRNEIPSINTDEIMLDIPDVNRPALQLMGFFEHFQCNRVQLIGNVEQVYLTSMMGPEERTRNLEMFFRHEIPCLILTRGYMPTKEMSTIAERYGRPILTSKRSTSHLMSQIIRYLSYELAPMISIHGVLVDVYGEGVLITGDSGVGKSEIALELIRRGHRLVSDDVVEIKKISDEELIGSAPKITRHFMELRGIGIINARDLYGVGSVKDTQKIDLNIDLINWDKWQKKNGDKTDYMFDRLGTQETYTSLLDIQVPSYQLPITPGRNVAIIIESAAINHRQKMMGFNAAKVFLQRVEENMQQKMAMNAARKAAELAELAKAEIEENQ
ncbi:MAG: HPr(Ser) kinase/phosphatase [Lachnospiraceae bacterium]